MHVVNLHKNSAILSLSLVILTDSGRGDTMASQVKTKETRCAFDEKTAFRLFECAAGDPAGAAGIAPAQAPVMQRMKMYD